MKTIYPYLYTRGAFQKKKLLKREDYEKLLKMELSEVIKFLEETEYKKAIDELALSLGGLDLVEAALNKGLSDFFRKARNIADMQTKAILDNYLERWDIYNAKTVLRAILSKTPPEKASLLLIPAGKHGKDHFIDAMKSPSIEEAIKKMDILGEKVREQALLAYAGGKSLMQAENALDHAYYRKIFRQAKRMGAEHFHFKRFLEDEVAMINLKTIVMMKGEGVDSSEIRKYLIQKEGIEDPQISSLLSAPSMEAMIGEIKKGSYGKHLPPLQEISPMEVEIAFDRYLAEKYLSSYMNPLSIAPLLTIMFIKAAEVSNLKGLVKAKQLGMEESFIEQKVVMTWWK